MKIAIVTAYADEPTEVLRRCTDSVQKQTLACTQLLVADGRPRPELDAWGIQHVKLPVCHNDSGDTPRFVGSVMAHAQGFNALCWLDADNWYEPDHVERCLALAFRDRVAVVTATRTLRRRDESALGIDAESNGDDFNDTNCYFLLRDAMLVACDWGFKRSGVIDAGDRVFWSTVKRFFPERAHSSKPTVNYTTTIAGAYLMRGERPPEDAKVWVQFEEGKPPTAVSYWKLLESQGSAAAR